MPTCCVAAPNYAACARSCAGVTVGIYKKIDIGRSYCHFDVIPMVCTRRPSRA